MTSRAYDLSVSTHEDEGWAVIMHTYKGCSWGFIACIDEPGAQTYTNWRFDKFSFGSPPKFGNELYCLPH